MNLTIVLGASPNPDRFSNRAVRSLVRHGKPVAAVGYRSGEVAGINIQTGKPMIEDVHTITVYMSPEHQKDYYDYMLSLHPQRIIFNPGAENPEFYKICRERDIKVIEDCTLILLNSGTF